MPPSGNIREHWRALLPDLEQRKLVAGILADTIKTAHAAKPSCWMITYKPNVPYFNVNVGRAFTFSLSPERIALILDTTKFSDGQIPGRWRDNVSGNLFKVVPEATWRGGAIDEALSQWSDLRESYFSAVKLATGTSGTSPWWRSHSAEAVDVLREETGADLPDPDFPESPGSSVDDMFSLLDEFITSYPSSPAGQRHYNLYLTARQEFLTSFARLKAERVAGRDITDDVLLKLLPYGESAGNRTRGAWRSPAPVITKDLKQWFEGAGWAEPEHWPTVANLIMDFFEACEADPANLESACKTFAGKNPAKGFQSAILSAGLICLNPQAFCVVNKKPRKILQWFAGKKYSSSIRVYPESNRELLNLVELAGGTLAAADAFPDLEPNLQFDMFTHWCVAVKKWEPGKNAGRAYEAKDSAGGGTVVKEGTPGYWLFQANPKIFDLARELQISGNEALDSWRVTRYAKEMKPGDKVLMWQAGKAAGIYGTADIIGESASATADDVETDKYLTLGDHVVPIHITDVLDKPITKADLLNHPQLNSLQVIRSPQGTNFKVSQEEWAAVEALRVQTVPTASVVSLATVAELTGFDLPDLQRWVKAINRKGQGVLYGPPGTGKTFVADHLARHLVGGTDGFVELIQFHPAYTYEDFIQGLRPEAAANGGLDYRLVPGRFLEFCRKAKKRTGPCVLVLDEINRANLARVFGELMYLLEYRDQTVALAGGGELSIPQNVRIIGTMNTADRSIALVDHALRRRFAFIQLRPQYHVLEKFHKNNGFEAAKLAKVLQKLNQAIDDPHYEVGISFFMKAGLGEHLEDIWRMEIEPYLEEYFFDQAAKAKEFRWAKIEGELQ